VDGWMGGWMDGWMGGWVDGIEDFQLVVCGVSEVTITKLSKGLKPLVMGI